MKKVRLSFWYKGSNPGDVIEVSEEELAVMKRDGRVAEVLDGDKTKPAKGVQSPENKKANEEGPK